MAISEYGNILTPDDGKVEDGFTAVQLKEMLLQREGRCDAECIQRIIGMYEERSINLEETLVRILAVYCGY